MIIDKNNAAAVFDSPHCSIYHFCLGYVGKLAQQQKQNNNVIRRIGFELCGILTMKMHTGVHIAIFFKTAVNLMLVNVNNVKAAVSPYPLGYLVQFISKSCSHLQNPLVHLYFAHCGINQILVLEKTAQLHAPFMVAKIALIHVIINIAIQQIDIGG